MNHKKMNRKHPLIRVLHVVHELNPGGIENWLINLVRRINREKIQMDFLIHTAQPQTYNKEILSSGSLIFPCPWPKRPLKYRKELQRILHVYGPYDIIHCHTHHYSGWVLGIANNSGVPVTIAHSHNDISMIRKDSSIIKKPYYIYMKYLVKKYSTLGLAASEKAAASLFGSKWQKDPKWRVLHCGIDLQPFNQSFNSKKIRSELNIPHDSLVIGHVGKFAAQKNHDFLIDIIPVVAKKHPVHVLLIGDGKLKDTICEKVTQMGLSKNVFFLGLRDDVPRLMMAAMDIFVFPSLWEGLGLVIIEAQAAGLPCIISDSIPAEADIIPELISRLSLSASEDMWAKRILSMYEKQKSDPYPQSEALKILKASRFNIKQSCSSIESLYQTEIDRKTQSRDNP